VTGSITFVNNYALILNGSFPVLNRNYKAGAFNTVIVGEFYIDISKAKYQPYIDSLFIS
jgi:hypothetical protein